LIQFFFFLSFFFSFCDYLKDADKTSLLNPLLEPIAAGVLSMATQFSESVLALTLDTLIIVVKVLNLKHNVLIFYI